MAEETLSGYLLSATSILTNQEVLGLERTAGGLMETNRQAAVPPPELLNVHCDCCVNEGTTEMQTRLGRVARPPDTIRHLAFHTETGCWLYHQDSQYTHNTLDTNLIVLLKAKPGV